ncbi:MAG TPA: hypothetical protein VEC12_10630 [Bacteroidia bacterium]|nr:hypothetical protein [Bacteroidia bacterium]
MRQLVACIVLLLTVITGSCKKDKVFHVKGRVLDGCNGTPVEGAILNLNGSDDQKEYLFPDMCKDDKVAANAITDANGEFIIRYDEVCEVWSLALDIFKKSGNANLQQLVLSVPVNKDVDLGDLNIQNSISCAVSIATDTSYSASDILVFNIRPKVSSGQRDSTFKSVSGPFADNQVVDTLIIPASVLISSDSADVTYKWLLKNGSRFIKPTFLPPGSNIPSPDDRPQVHQVKSCLPCSIRLNISR